MSITVEARGFNRGSTSKKIISDMTNKEFQEILAKYPDDYIIQMDNAFGWETPSSKHIVDPNLYINTDFGFIEIEPEEIRDIWVRTKDELPKDGQEVVMLVGVVDGLNPFTEMGSYDAKEKTFTGEWNYFDDCETIYKPKDIIAWMPIPKYENEEK